MRNLPDNNELLREEVCRAYSLAALNPSGEHCFPLGMSFAVSLGYPSDLLAGMPESAVSAFTGVSNVSMFAEIPPGAVVLDLGCGAGLDALIAASRVGLSGKVIGVDFSETMLDRARQAAKELGVKNVEFHHADAKDLPIDDEAIDVALVNGIFNLNPGRKDVIRELGRVLRPGGSVYAAELVLRESLPDETCSSKSNWFAWIAGAKEGVAFLEELREAGFCETKILRTMRNARTMNPKVLAAEVFAQKSDQKI